MTLKECCRILGVARTAQADDVKRAYRRRAFELHPDLNPQLIDANRQFQLLNEAYVTLLRVLPPEEPRAASRESRTTSQPDPQKDPQPDPQPGPQPDNFSSDTDGTASDPQGDTASDAPDPNEARGHARTAQPGQTRTDHAQADWRSRAEKARDATAGSRATGGTGGNGGNGGNDASRTNFADTDPDADTSAERQRRMADAAYTQREDVLRDILNDQFARRVFEDIYSELSKQRPAPDKADKKARTPEKPSLPPPKKRKLNLEWGDTMFKLDLSEGLGGMVRSWLRRQIDDTLTVRLPAAKLFAGARVRLQIRQGLAQELRVIEVTLPPDFKTGKPIRLKGMGRKVGKWTGDLYLTIEAAS